jgi:hypothetical protein
VPLGGEGCHRGRTGSAALEVGARGTADGGRSESFCGTSLTQFGALVFSGRLAPRHTMAKRSLAGFFDKDQGAAANSPYWVSQANVVGGDPEALEAELSVKMQQYVTSLGGKRVIRKVRTSCCVLLPVPGLVSVSGWVWPSCRSSWRTTVLPR